jgi:hypothetical protein
MSFVIQTIVEGLGEHASMRILIQRIASTFCNLPYVDVLRPMNTNGIGNLLTRLEGFVENAADKIAQTGQKGGIIVLLDSDKKCPAETAPSFDKLCRDLTAMLTKLSNTLLPPLNSR